MVSFGQEQFDIVIGFRYRSRHMVQGDEYKPHGLRQLWFRVTNKTEINWLELVKLFLTYEFASDEDTIKMTIFYFIELAMMRRERRQHWEDF